MTVLSKQSTRLADHLYYFLFNNPKKKALNGTIVWVICFLSYSYIKNKRLDRRLSKEINLHLNLDNSQQKGSVDKEFFNKLTKLIKIVIPKWHCRESLDLLLFTIFLFLRTSLSIHLATIKGRIVKGIVQLDIKLFLKGLFNMVLCSFPGSFINSSLTYFQNMLSVRFRKRITDYFMKRYLKELTYYQLTNLDMRIQNPDQRLTSDIQKWSQQLSQLYSNISKPILDIFLYSRKLNSFIGIEGPLYIIFWYIFSAFLLRSISPVFGKLIATEQKLEGLYRQRNTDLVLHSEEISFYKGYKYEKQQLHQNFRNLINQTQSIISKRLYLGMFDSVLIKYGAMIVGYSVIGLPVFGKKYKDKYLNMVEKDAAKITRDYVRNSSLLIDLAGAIGRLLVSYKTLQLLAGYTTLVYELMEVFDDLEQGRYQKTQIVLSQQPQLQNQVEKQLDNVQNQNTELNIKQSMYLQNIQNIMITDYIEFDKVPVISPTGEPLVNNLTFKIEKGMNCIIIGPNGCGKSSCFRILAQLWPCYGGQLSRPQMKDMFYIPQRPYLPQGNLIDQIIYPHNLNDMATKLKSGKNDGQEQEHELHLMEILQQVNLGYVYDKYGMECQTDWNDVLSGGEKQRLAMARLLYHTPQFAILDECTSSTSLDVETLLYNKCKEKGITLFTISHRASLFKFHDYMLVFDGEGGWSFESINKDQGNDSQLFQQAMQKKVNTCMTSKLKRKVTF